MRKPLLSYVNNKGRKIITVVIYTKPKPEAEQTSLSFTWSRYSEGRFAYDSSNEPSHEIMVLFILRKLILQMRMRSHPMGLDV